MCDAIRLSQVHNRNRRTIGNGGRVVEAIALVLTLGTIALVTGYTLITGAPPLPSGRRVRLAAIEMIPEDRTADLADLGAGWGGLAIAMARRWPDARVTAYERSPIPALVLLIRVRLAGPANLTVCCRDFLTADLTPHQAATCYVNTVVMTKLEAKRRREGEGFPALVSIFFSLPNSRPTQITMVGDMHRSSVYLYLPEEAGMTE